MTLSLFSGTSLRLLAVLVVVVTELWRVQRAMQALFPIRPVVKMSPTEADNARKETFCDDSGR